MRILAYCYLFFYLINPLVGQINHDIKHITYSNVFLTPEFLLRDTLFRENFKYPIENYIKKDASINTYSSNNYYRVIIYYKYKMLDQTRKELFDDFSMEKINDTDYVIKSNFIDITYQRTKLKTSPNSFYSKDKIFADIYNALEHIDSNKYYFQFSNYGCVQIMDCHEKAYMIVYKNNKMIYGIFSLGSLIIKRQDELDIKRPAKKDVKNIYDNLVPFAKKEVW